MYKEVVQAYRIAGLGRDLGTGLARAGLMTMGELIIYYYSLSQVSCGAHMASSRAIVFWHMHQSSIVFSQDLTVGYLLLIKGKISSVQIMREVVLTTMRKTQE